MQTIENRIIEYMRERKIFENQVEIIDRSSGENHFLRPQYLLEGVRSAPSLSNRQYCLRQVIRMGKSPQFEDNLRTEESLYSGEENSPMPLRGKSPQYK